MYIVRTGVVSIQDRSSEREITLAKSGDVVGEMALLGFSKDGKRLRTSVCLTMCEVCMMTQVYVQ